MSILGTFCSGCHNFFQMEREDALFVSADEDGDGKIGLSDAKFFKKSKLPVLVLGEVIDVYFLF